MRARACEHVEREREEGGTHGKKKREVLMARKRGRYSWQEKEGGTHGKKKREVLMTRKRNAKLKEDSIHAQGRMLLVVPG